MRIRPHVALDERLRILRGADYFRTWASLDDERVCVLCQRTFTGRQIDIKRDRHGRFHLCCPTEGCGGGPNRWVFPGSLLVSETGYPDWWRAPGRSNRRTSGATSILYGYQQRYA